MADSNENFSTNQFYNSLLMQWLLLFTSQLMFLVVLYFVVPGLFKFDLSKPFLDQNWILIIIFAIVALINLALSILLKRRFIHQAVSEQKVGFVQTAMIVGCTLCECVTLFGFMLALVAEYQYFFLWFFAGIAGMLFHFPSRRNVMDASFAKEGNLA